MVESLLLRWILTALFALTAAWCGYRIAAPVGGWRDRISSAAHVAMSLLMIAMAWPWGMAVPMLPQIALFTIAAAWFLVLTALRVPCGHLRRAARLAHAHHAATSAAMVWMVATMPALMAGSHDSGGSGHHHALGAPHSGVLAAAAAPTGHTARIPLITAAIAAILVLSSTAWIASAADTGRTSTNRTTTRHALDSACHGAMSAGMGFMLFAML